MAITKRNNKKNMMRSVCDTLGKKHNMSATDVITMRHNLHEDLLIYDKRSTARIVIGITMICVGMITVFIPLTTAPLIIGGCAMIGWDYKKVVNKIKYEFHLFKLRWLK